MKRKRAALGIDFGTTSISAALIDLDESAVLQTASEKARAYISCKNPLYREQDPKKVRGALYRTVSSCVRRFDGAVVSIGITGQMHGIVGLDEEGKAVTDLVTWQDRRGHERGTDGRTVLEEMAARGGARAVSTGYGVVTLFDWTVRKGRSDIRKVCTIPDYFGMMLTGRRDPLTDPTMADSSGAYDLQHSAWDEDYLGRLGIDPGLFPEIVPSSTVQGRLEDRVIRSLLGGESPPVACCVGDNQASFIGGVRHHDDSLLVNIGTASQVSFCIEGPDDGTPVPSIDGEMPEDNTLSVDGFDVVIRPFTTGKLLVSGNALSGGCSYGRLALFFEEAGKTLFGLSGLPDLYERMSAIVEGWDSSEGMEVRPCFSGTRRDPGLRGSVLGLSDDNFTPRNLVYGTMEGIVVVLKDMIEPAILAQRKWLVGGGNMLRKNKTMQKIVSRVFGKDLVIPLHEEEAAAGASIHGAVAAGFLSGYSEAKRIIRYG